jgi:hypothetical protein
LAPPNDIAPKFSRIQCLSCNNPYEVSASPLASLMVHYGSITLHRT